MRGGVVLTCVAKQCDLAMNSSSNGSYLFVLDLSVDCWSPGLDFYDSVQTPTKDDSTPREMAPKIPKYVRSDVDERAWSGMLSGMVTIPLDGEDGGGGDVFPRPTRDLVNSATPQRNFRCCLLFAVRHICCIWSLSPGDILHPGGPYMPPTGAASPSTINTCSIHTHWWEVEKDFFVRGGEERTGLVEEKD